MRASAISLLAALAVTVCLLSAWSQRTATPTAAETDRVSFSEDIMPLISRLGCNTAACHGSAQGKGGLRLSLFGAYPRRDYEALTRLAPGRWINTIEPQRSLLLLKVTGALPHAGATPVLPGSPDHGMLVSWVTSGAWWGDDDAPALVSVAVTPGILKLNKGLTGTIKAEALYADGHRRDITASAQYKTSDRDVVGILASGTVQAKDFGETFVVVSYLRRSAVARVIVPRPLAAPFPKAPVANKIDELVLAKLVALGLPPSPRASDSEFLRRVYLDVTGLLPTPEQAKAFLADADPKKRATLIDRLLDSEECVDFRALRWGDLLRIKSEYPSNLWPNGVQAYARYVRHSLATNKPYDQFVRELLVSSGSNFRSAPANYYRALRKRDAQGYAESAALVFMGARLGCASCHAHPTENWTLDDNLGMAAFFTQVRIKGSNEWKEEIVYIDPKATFQHPITKQTVAPRPLGGDAVTLSPGEDPRARFAEWLTSTDNPWFARNMVNRIWYWTMGRGIVEEVDDMRPTNPPTNPELLDYLAKELVDHRHDLKHVYRLVLNSETYQRTSAPNAQNAGDVAHFPRYPVKRLSAEQLLDAINRVTETFDKYESRIPEPYTVLPDGTRAGQLDDGSIGTPFLELFGRPPRDTAFEGDRSFRTSMRQALFLINSSDLAGKISRSPRVKRWLDEKKTDAEIVDEIYLAALSRYPTDDEKKRVIAYLEGNAKNRRQAVEDVLWAILNTKEFLFNH